MAKQPFRRSIFRRSAASKAISMCVSKSLNGVVVNAWTQAELFRGFEIILRDKDPQAGSGRDAARLRHLRGVAPYLRSLGARHRLGYDSAAQRHPCAQPSMRFNQFERIW